MRRIVQKGDSLRSDSLYGVLRNHRRLLMLALYCELIYLLFFVRQFPLLRYYRGLTDLGRISNYSQSGFVAFVGLFLLLFVLLTVAWDESRSAGSPATIWAVLGTGGVFALTMSFVYPVTAIDLYTYVDQSWILVHYHQNPILVPPSSFPRDPWMQLADGWRDVGAPYGPIGVIVDALPVAIFGKNLLAVLLGLKVLFSGFAVAAAYLVYRILRVQRCGSPVVGAVLVAWNPVVLFEISANGHNDALMMLFALLAILFALENHFTLAVVFLTISTLVKFATIVLFPLIILYCLARIAGRSERAQFLAGAFGWAALLTVLTYLPFWFGIDTFDRSLLEGQMYVASFALIVSNTFQVVSVDHAVLGGRLLFIPVYGYALWRARRDGSSLIFGCFLVIFFFLALAVTNVKSWYSLWPMMLAAAIPGLPVRLSAGLLAFGGTLMTAFFAYLYVWMGVYSDNSLALINDLSYAVMFLPAAGALGLIALRKGSWRASMRPPPRFQPTASEDARTTETS